MEKPIAADLKSGYNEKRSLRKKYGQFSLKQKKKIPSVFKIGHIL